MKDKRKEKVFIGEQNYWAIHDFIYHNLKDGLQGAKLEALYRLIQWKGKIIDCRPDQSFYGIKVLEYADDDFIGFIRTGFSKTVFFPCKLEIVALRTLGYCW